MGFNHTFSNSKVTVVISTIQNPKIGTIHHPKKCWVVTAIHHPKICWVVTKPSRKNLASEASKKKLGGWQNLVGKKFEKFQNPIFFPIPKFFYSMLCHFGLKSEVFRCHHPNPKFGGDSSPPQKFMVVTITCDYHLWLSTIQNNHAVINPPSKKMPGGDNYPPSNSRGFENVWLINATLVHRGRC